MSGVGFAGEQFLKANLALVGAVVIEEVADVEQGGDAPAEVEKETAEEDGVGGERSRFDAGIGPARGEQLVDACRERLGVRLEIARARAGSLRTGEAGQENRKQRCQNESSQQTFHSAGLLEFVPRTRTTPTRRLSVRNRTLTVVALWCALRPASLCSVH